MSDMTPEKCLEKGAWLGSRDPLNFWALSANSSKMTKGTNFKFSTFAPGKSPVMTPGKNFFHKGGVASIMWPRKLWALNVNSSKMAKYTNFNFGKHAPTDSPDMTPEKILDTGHS